MNGLLDMIGNAPAETGIGQGLLGMASALLTPRSRGGGMGAAFAALPQAQAQAQAMAQRNKIFGLQERQFEAETAEAERKRRQQEASQIARASLMQQITERGGFKPDMLPAALQAGIDPKEIELLAQGSRLGLPKLVNVNNVGVDPHTWQPVGAVPDPNKPFNVEIGPNGQMKTVDNKPYQSYEMTRTAVGAPSVNNYVMPATPGQEATDKKFATDFVEFATGGYADVVKQLDQLREAAKVLGSGANISGPILGSTPDAVLAFTNPDAVATKELIQEVAQRNLRLVLGAQFTEKEGERLIARVFNPRLSEEENAKRVNRLINQISEAAKAKLDAAQYFQQNGSLTGWKGRLPRLIDFDPDFGKKESGATGSFDAPKQEGTQRKRYNPATGQVE